MGTLTVRPEVELRLARATRLPDGTWSKGLSEPQCRLLSSIKTRVLFRGGIRSGKTFGGALWALTRPPDTIMMVAAPTHRMLAGAAVETMLEIIRNTEQAARDAGYPLKLIADYNKQEGFLRLTDGKLFLLRSLERAQNLRGPTVNYIWGDELGILKDRTAWDVLIGRMSKSPAQALVTTTPGKTGKSQWLYQVFVTDADPDLTEVIGTKTSDNHALRAGYEGEMRREYTEAGAALELDGEWVDLVTSEVYDTSQLIVGQLPPPDQIVRTVRAWDVASTSGAGDYTAGLLLSIDKANHLYIRDVVRGQWDPAERDAMMLATAHADTSRVPIIVPQERGGAGKGQAFTFIRMLIKFNVKAVAESGDKVIRAGPLAAQIGHGNVSLTAENGRWENYWHDGKRLDAAAARGRLLKNLGDFPAIRTKDESDAGAAALEAIVTRDTGISVYRRPG